MPDFFIIAGPNGAGKSTYAQQFIPSSVAIFNGDLVFAELISKYPQIEPIRLQGGVAVALEKARDEALVNNKSFAFESNYSSKMASEITKLFKDAGYTVTILYFGITDTVFSKQRVLDRVKLGGHYVDLPTITYNFNEGIKRVNANLSLYDNVLFIDALENKAKIIALYKKSTGIKTILTDGIDWFETNFKKIFMKL